MKNNEVLEQMVKQMIWKTSAHTASYMYTIDKLFLLVKMLNAVTLRTVPTIVIAHTFCAS